MTASCWRGVDAVEPEALVCTVVRGGVLQSRKSLAVLGADIQMPTLTAEDKENLPSPPVAALPGSCCPLCAALDIRSLRQALEAGAPQLKLPCKIRKPCGRAGATGVFCRW